MKALFLLALLGPLNVLAHTPVVNKAQEPLEPQMRIDKDIVDKIYKESLMEASVDTRPYTAGFLVAPSMSSVNLKDLTLNNNYFRIPYQESYSGVTTFALDLARPLAFFGDAEVLGVGQVGYGYKETLTTAYSKTSATNTRRRTLIRLQWMPLLLGGQVTYRFPQFPWIRPIATVMGGAQWLYQSGNLDGLEQGFWVPYYKAGLSVALFDYHEKDGDWFGGINLGYSFQSGISSDQSVKSSSIDLGLRFFL